MEEKELTLWPLRRWRISYFRGKDEKGKGAERGFKVARIG